MIKDNESNGSYEIETTTDVDGNVHLWAWVVNDQVTGERVHGKTIESFLEFLKCDIYEDNNHIHSKAKELLEEIAWKE